MNNNNILHNLGNSISRIWDTIPLPIFAYDNRGNLVYANSRSKETFLIDKKEDMSTIADMFNLKHFVKTQIDEVFMDSQQEMSFSVQINPLTKNIIHHHQINSIEYHATLSKLYDSNNVTNGYFLVLEESTELVRSYKIMKDAQKHLQEAENIKDSFLANFSHEVRTPLNAIIGFSELMAETNSVEKKQEYMKYIYVNNEQLLRSITDILDLSRIDIGYTIKPQKKDFSNCFDQLALSLKELNTNKNVEIEIVNPFKKILAEVDFPRIAQVVTNFASNAMKFTPKGKITIGYSYIDGIMEVYVKDTGIGIPQDKQHLMFERFQKVDPFSKGSGLGLSIVKALMSPFGVECGFESTFGKGSYFWAKGPLVMTEIFVERKEPTKQHFEHTNSSIEKLSKNLNILVAEDNDTNYFLLTQILGEDNTLFRARDGQEAVLLNRKQKFDLIIMDIRMPIMDGFKATSIIRRKDKNVPIIALSSGSLEVDNVYAIEVGCNKLLNKPIRKQTLLNAIFNLYHGVDKNL